MIPVTFDGANAILRAPPGMDNCVDLPFYREDHEGLITATSCWQLTEQEVKDLIKTKHIMVQVCGNTFPPMRMIVVPEQGMI